MEDGTGANRHIQALLVLILPIAFLGQLYIRPFMGDFRFSPAVPVLALVLLYFPFVPPLFYSIIVGAVMLLLRGMFAAVAEETTVFVYCLQHASVLVFYVTYGCLFSLLKIQKWSEHGIPLFFSLLTCEVLANSIELLTTQDFLTKTLEESVFFVVVVGIIRSGGAAALYRLTIYWQERHDSKRREENYRRMLLFFATIKTDLLFFHKSMDDIESAMKCSYSLYEKLKGGEQGEEALTVSRRIHDVKKEYQRIITSMEKVLSEEYVEQRMLLSDIFAVLRVNTETLLSVQKIPIVVSFKCDDNWVIGHYYTIISIINNLVINAVEAMAGRVDGGTITVTAWREDGVCVIEVADNGPGIAEDLLDCLFDPGFSTKFNPATGEMSTGIGLAHVKNLVENHYGGRIMIHSNQEGARFRILLPEERMNEGSTL